MNLQFPDFNLSQGRTQGRKGTWFLFAPLLFCGLSQSVARAQSADEILSAVRSAEAKAQFRATQIIQRGGSREVATLYRSGLKRRMEWSAPSVKAGDLLIDNGETLTLFHQSDRTAIQTQSARRGAVLGGGNWKVGAPKQQDGRTVRILSRGNGRELTIDAKTNVILRNKTANSVTSLQNVQFGAVPASKFQFAAPSGVQVVRTQGRLFGDLNAAKRFTSWLRAPSKLPDGYSFESAVAGKNEVWLRYSDGKKRFSLFQQKAADPDLAPKKIEGAWFWRKNGLRYVATGVPDEAVAALAK